MARNLGAKTIQADHGNRHKSLPMRRAESFPVLLDPPAWAAGELFYALTHCLAAF